jgi:uncharacterized membrane protein (DUF485 family)
MNALIKATTSFVTEKIIIQRERRTGAYSVAPYFLSKLVAEAPLAAVFPCLTGAIIYQLCGLNSAPGRFAKFLAILTVESFAATALGMAVGSWAPSVEAAIAIAPSVMVIFIVFGGLYVVNVPTYLSWVPQMSLIRWAYEALCVNEFSGLALKPSARMGPRAYTHGEQVLDSMGMGASTLRGALLAQGGIVLFNWIFTYISLVSQRPAYEKVRKLTDKEKEEKGKEGKEGEEGEEGLGGEGAGGAKEGSKEGTKEGGKEGKSAAPGATKASPATKSTSVPAPKPVAVVPRSGGSFMGWGGKLF